MYISLAITLGNLELNVITASVLGIATVTFFGSFIFIAKTNDMKGALLSLLPKRKK